MAKCAIKGCQLQPKQYDLCIKHLIMARDAKKFDPKDPDVKEARRILVRGINRRKAEEAAGMMEDKGDPQGKDGKCRVPGCGKPAKRRGLCGACANYLNRPGDDKARCEAIRAARLPSKIASRKARGPKAVEPETPITPPPPKQTALVEQARPTQAEMQRFAGLLALEQMPVAGGHLLHNPATAHVVYLTGNEMHRIDLPGQETTETDP